MFDPTLNRIKMGDTADIIIKEINFFYQRDSTLSNWFRLVVAKYR
jgi:hypothetical protein